MKYIIKIHEDHSTSSTYKFIIPTQHETNSFIWFSLLKLWAKCCKHSYEIILPKEETPSDMFIKAIKRRINKEDK